MNKNSWGTSLGEADAELLRLENLRLNAAIRNAKHIAMDDNDHADPVTFKRRRWFDSLCAASGARKVNTEGWVTVRKSELLKLRKFAKQHGYSVAVEVLDDEEE